MNIKEYAKNSKVPLKALYVLLDRQAIGNSNLSSEDLYFLTQYEKVWGNEKLLKYQFTKKNKSERSRIVETAKFSKWESYCYGKLKRAFCENKKISTTELLEEVQVFFTISPLVNKKLRIRQLRDKARYSVKKQNARA